MPDDCLIGGKAGEGKGFYFTMRGFVGGRLQTAARACGGGAAFGMNYSQIAWFSASPSLATLCRSQACSNGCLDYRMQGLRYVAGLAGSGSGQMEASLVKLFLVVPLNG